MDCPFCTHVDTRVLESRLVTEGVRRRRECSKCAKRFTTYEKVFFKLTVQKKDGRIQPFDAQKILRSLQRSCVKTNDEQLQEVASRVERRLLAKKTNQLTTKEIGRQVLRELKKLNKVAYVRFASVHKAIDDPKLLEKELQTIVE